MLTSWTEKGQVSPNGGLYHYSLSKKAFIGTTDWKYDQKYCSPCAWATAWHSTLGMFIHPWNLYFVYWNILVYTGIGYWVCTIYSVLLIKQGSELVQGSRKMKVPSPLNWLRILKLLIEEITFYLYGLLLAERKFSLVDTLCKLGLKDSAFPLKRRGSKSIPDEQFLNFFRFPFLLFLLLLSSPKGFFFSFRPGRNHLLRSNQHSETNYRRAAFCLRKKIIVSFFPKYCSSILCFRKPII